LFGLIELT